MLRKLQTLNADENYIEYLPEEVWKFLVIAIFSLLVSLEVPVTGDCLERIGTN